MKLCPKCDQPVAEEIATCPSCGSEVGELEIPAGLEVLLKVMLADDPDLRPQSMTEVAQSPARIKSAIIEKASKDDAKEPVSPGLMTRALQKRMRMMAVTLLLVIVAGIFLARAQLEQLQKLRRDAIADSTQWNDYLTEVDGFNQKVTELLSSQKIRDEKTELTDCPAFRFSSDLPESPGYQKNHSRSGKVFLWI